MGGKVQRDCPVCGVTYEANSVRLSHGRETTCSRRCSYRYRAESKQRQVSLTCSVCEVEFTRSPAQIKAKHGASFCSPACQYSGRSLGLTPRVVSTPYVLVAPPRTAEETAKQVASRRAGKGYAHSDDSRRKLSEATTRAIAEGRISPISKCEDVVAEVLNSLGIGYARQAGIRGAGGRYVAAVDFLLADGRILEVNGTFWHSDPRTYPDGPQFPSQVRSAERWERKMAALDALGIPVHVVWEADLVEDATQAVRVALAAV